jgi:hypothetical protein
MITCLEEHLNASFNPFTVDGHILKTPCNMASLPLKAPCNVAPKLNIRNTLQFIYSLHASANTGVISQSHASSILGTQAKSRNSLFLAAAHCLNTFLHQSVYVYVFWWPKELDFPYFGNMFIADKRKADCNHQSFDIE